MRKAGNMVLILLGVLVALDLGWVNWKVLVDKGGPKVVGQDIGGCGRACVEEIVTAKLAGRETDMTGQSQTDGGELEKDGCDRRCVEQIVEERLAKVKKTATPIETPTPVQAGKTEVVKETRIETVDLAGGSASGGNWVKVGGSEKWLDADLYGELVKATWQGWLEVKDGNGIAYARLYDATNNRAVDGSQVSNSSGGKASFYSSALSLWRGQNQYYIQVKSSTGYQVTIESPRLKLEVK